MSFYSYSNLSLLYYFRIFYYVNHKIKYKTALSPLVLSQDIFCWQDSYDCYQRRLVADWCNMLLISLLRDGYTLYSCYLLDMKINVTYDVSVRGVRIYVRR